MHFRRPVFFWYLHNPELAIHHNHMNAAKIPRSSVQLLDSFSNLHRRLLDIILNTIKESSLIDDED